jgi:PAS domain S-box-containing protein
MSNFEKNIDAVSADYGIHILNHSSDKIIVLDHDYRLKYFNPSAQEYSFLFGIKQLELGFKMQPSKEAIFWKSSFDQALAGETLEFKKKYLIKDKKYTDLVNIYPLKNSKGKITEISFQSKNLTVSPFVQKNILEQENLFQSLFDTCPNGLTIRKFKTQQLISFNLKICEILGCTPEEFRTYDRSDFVFYEDLKEIAEKMKLLEQAKIENFKIEKQYKRKNGDVFWGVATRSILKIGGETYQVGILEDISKQKQFEEQLIKNEAKVKSILNSTTDKIFAIDKNYKLVDANQAALRTLASYNLNKPFDEVQLSDFDFAGDNPWKSKLDRAFNGEEFHFEGKYAIDGQDQFDLITVSPLKNAVGEIFGATIYGKEITELKKIQKALAQSEAQLQDAQRLAKLGYWELDVKTNRLNWSKGSYRIYGFPVEEKSISLEKYYSMTHPDDRDVFKNALELSIREGKSFGLHCRKVKPDGTLLYTFDHCEPYLENGVVTKVFGAIQDISTEGEIRNKLIKNEAKVRAILNSTNDKIFAIDRNYKLIDFNEPAVNILPPLFEKEKLEIGIEMLAQSKKSRNSWIEHYNKALAGERINVEKRYTHDGKIKTDIITLSPILNTTGEVTGVTVFGKEITDLQNTKQKYRDLFEDVYDAIVTIDQHGYMTDSNSAAERLIGYSKKELNKMLIKDIVHPDDQKLSEKYLQKLITEGYYSDYQGRIITKDGKIKYIQVNSNAIYENGEIVGSRDIIRDISQLKDDEENRNQLFAQLAAVNQELKDFAYIVSHDLKAPLRAIKNISNWLSEDYKDEIDEQGKQQLQLLTNRVNRMHQFIDGIFEYTKVGRIKETKEIVMIEEIITNINLMLNLKENVQINILKKLPEIYCEKIKIEQVFQNLISNAVKCNDKDTCKIEIDYEELTAHHLFKIKDNGKGIEEKNFEKIFQIFQTLQSKDDFESTGIGLSIVKRIVQLHGGEIKVKSKSGEYSIFEFTLEKQLPPNK